MAVPAGLTFLILFMVSVAVAEGSNGLTESAVSPTNQTYWMIEDAKAREQLPLYFTIPAAKPEELTPANGYPKREDIFDLASFAWGQRRDALFGAGSDQPPECD